MGEKVDKDEVLAVIRALLISHKGALTVRQCNWDYREQGGSDVPFRALGFDSLEALLRSASDFRLSSGPGGPLVQVRPSEETKHLALMVARQKPGSRKLALLRKPHQSTPPWRGKRGGYRGRGQHRGGNYPGGATRWGGERDASGAGDRERWPARAARAGYSPTPPSSAPSSPPTPPPARRPRPPSPPARRPPSPSPPARRPRSPPARRRSPPPPAAPVAPAAPAAPAARSKLSGLCPEGLLAAAAENGAEDARGAGRGRGARLSAADRLQSLQMQMALAHIGPPELPASVSPSEPVASLSPESAPAPLARTVHLPTLLLGPIAQGSEGSKVRQLWELCTEHELPEPLYKDYDCTNSACKPRDHLCKVRAGDATYSSYPATASDAAAAREAAAANALAALGALLAAAAAADAPPAADADGLLALERLVAANPAGVIAENLPALYRDAYSRAPPDGWLESVRSGMCGVALEQVANGILVLSAASPGKPEAPTPPAEDAWSVYVCRAADLDDLSLRFIGPRHSDALDALTEELSAHCESAFAAVEADREENEWRAVRMAEGEWHRAVVADGRLRLVDYHDEEFEPGRPEDVRPLPARFLALPRQIFRARLAGLDWFARATTAGGPVAKAARDAVGRLFGRSLVAEPAEPLSAVEPVADVAVYLVDTSGEEDVPLNRAIAGEALAAAAPPLPSFRPAVAVVTHVDDECRVWVARAEGAELARASLRDALCGLPEFLLRRRGAAAGPGDAVLVKREGEPLRARVEEADGDGATLMLLLMDSGERASARAEDALPLERLSPALAELPPQATPLLPHGARAPAAWLAPRLRVALTPGAEVRFARPDEAPRAPPGLPADVYASARDSIVEILLLDDDGNFTVSLARSLNELWQSEGAAANGDAAAAEELFDAVDSLPEPAMPAVGDRFDVYITMAASPSNFIVQPAGRRKEMKAMMAALQEACARQAPPGERALAAVRPGHLVALWSEEEGAWHRAAVQQRLNGAAACQLLDFGEAVFARLSGGGGGGDALRPLPGRAGDGAPWRRLPAQAVRARLARARPAHADWTPEDCVRFQKLCADRYLSSVVRDAAPPLVLDLVDVVDPHRDLWIADLFAQEGRLLA